MQLPMGNKRFELRLPRSSSELWLEVIGAGVYHKPGSVLEPQCAYVDLAPGTHRIVLHGKRRDLEVGLQTGLTVYEYAKGAAAARWYEALRFSCGGLGACTSQHMAAFSAAQRRRPRGVIDRCGSVLIRELRYVGVLDAEQPSRYSELTLRFALKVYAFEPHRAPAAPDCDSAVEDERG